MSAQNDGVQRSDDDPLGIQLAAGKRFMSSLTKETLKRLVRCNVDDVQAAIKRYESSKDAFLDPYPILALVAEIGSLYVRDAPKSEKTVADEYEELSFREPAGTQGQDSTTTTCTGTNPYSYPTLLPDQSAIRLVVLLPSRERHADIVCELCNSALTGVASSRYEALSYVWGDPTRRKPIVVSRQLFQATENLEAALRNLRHPTKPRVLWIDAICINQNDIQERNDQVQLMGHIYRSALRVIVWLGPESDTSGTAFQVMNNKPDVPDFESASHEIIELFVVDLMPALLSFCRLTMRPWFRRVWCIQEIALARAVDFQCGQHRATMSDFLWIDAFFFTRRLVMPAIIIPEAELSKDNISATDEMRFFRQLADLHKLLLVTGIPGSGSDLESSSSALGLLDGFQDWLCSNDKDRIFAFYGLLSGGSPGRDALRPNYSLSVAQVYIRFAVRYLQQHKDLNILVIATRPLPGFVDISAARELPSWVPDWRDVPRHGRCSLYSDISISYGQYSDQFCFQDRLMYDACLGNQAAPLEFRHDFRTLCLHGVVVDNVEVIGPLYLGSYRLRDEDKLEVLSTWKNIAAPSAEHCYPYTGEPGHDAFWRTLQIDEQRLEDHTEDDIAYMNQNLELPYKEQETVLHAIRGRGSSRLRIPPGAPGFFPAGEDDVRYLKSLITRQDPMVGRRFFKTAKGLFGLGPASAGVNDEVAVLLGGMAPFVLRSVGESHRVIGECYVHGIMDGEAIHRPRRREFADLRDKEFHLI